MGGHCEATTRAVECQGSTTWPVGGKASDDEVCPTPIEASARSYEVCRRFDKRRRGLSEMRRGLSEVQRACFYRYASVFVGNAFLMRSGRVSIALLRKKRRFAVFGGIRHPYTRFLQLSPHLDGLQSPQWSPQTTGISTYFPRPPTTTTSAPLVLSLLHPYLLSHFFDPHNPSTTRTLHQTAGSGINLSQLGNNQRF
ncbi:hypothetical protein Acr_00g0079880 [Actinidia rufa]|uniref:Uncharacterized protein n=1 Tax=Actinidia rufa TaxID=165716 RepID=A0A7J0DUI0_9ERIC|nr:hypothetical protein Acr_00g0079880 [Actinidia rufa]